MDVPPPRPARLALTGGVIWLVWVFACGVALGVLVTVAVWLSGSRLVQRIVALADYADVIIRAKRGRQDISDEQEGSAGS